MTMSDGPLNTIRKWEIRLMYFGVIQGLRHADENGGDGDQVAAKLGFSSEGNPYQKPKSQRIWPTIFLKMGG